jgi:hypothetical protein
MDSRILAGVIVVESELSKQAKLQLLKFLQYEATPSQVKAFILDGEIVHLDEQAAEIINDRFAVSEAGGRVAQMRKSYFGTVPASAAGGAISGGIGGGIAGGMAGAVAAGKAGAILGAAGGAAGGALPMVGAAALWALYRVIRSRFDKCTKRCGTLEMNTARRQFCMAKCKVSKLQEELKAAVKSKNAKEINKKKSALAKAQKTFANYQKSFKGKESPQ